MGLVEVERLQQAYDLDVRFSPFFLDPTTPPEGKPRRRVTGPEDPPTPIELRGESLGLTYTRGRSWSSNSHLALEAAEFAAEHGATIPFHRAMFKAYFEDLAEIGDVETLVRVGSEVGLPADELRKALTSGRYRNEVDEEIAWAQQIGVTAVPTFVLGGKYAIVGAQESQVFENILQTRLGQTPK